MEEEIIFVVDEAPEGGYQAKALGHSIFTEADGFEELKKMVQDVVVCHFEEMNDRPVLHYGYSAVDSITRRSKLRR